VTEQSNKSWDDLVDRLRGAAHELREAAGREGAPSAEEEAAAARLKNDVTRLEQSAAELRAKLTTGLDAQRKEFETALDRDRAEQAARQVRTALDELLGLARTVTLELKEAATASLTRAQPELKTAIRNLEDVASSTGAWVRTVIDDERQPGARTERTKPPLDDL
jgi:predicted component of type VI protein secretion system